MIQSDRNFDPAHLEQLKQDGSLNFYENAPKQDGILEKIGEFLLNVGSYVADIIKSHLNINIPPAVFDILIYGFVAAGVVYVILKMTGADIVTIFRRNSRGKGKFKPHTVVEENLDNVDLDQLITEFVSQKNWMLAIRYYYLNTLKTLTNRGLIEYQLRKTNSEYYHELKDEKLAGEFRQMALVFEQIWYGRIVAEKAGCDQVANHFKNIKSQST